MELKEWLKAKNLDENCVHKEKVVVDNGETVHMIAPPTATNARVMMTPVTRVLETPEEYKELLANTPSTVTMMPDGVEGCHVDGVEGEEADKLKAARTEAVRFVYGNGKISSDARKEIVKRYFPLKVTLAAAHDVTINTGGTYTINGGVGEYHFGTMTIHEGGHLVVNSNANVIIDKLVKAARN